MISTAQVYDNLSIRQGFNASVRHINSALDILDEINPKKNMADAVNQLLSEKQIQTEQISALMHMLLVEKLQYSVASRNLAAVLTKPAELIEQVAKWKAIDIVLGYHHPDLGFIVFNPKNPDSIPVLEGLRKNELLIVYAGNQKDDPASKKNASLAIDCILRLIEGRICKTPEALLSGSFMYVKPKVVAPKKTKTKTVVAKKATKVEETDAKPEPTKSAVTVAAPSLAVPGQVKLTPLISVVVSNELFHNGNVEAWKRIIRSYNAKYPTLQVYIYYEGERIIDINTLFKWGKVKHGSCIQFRVQGEDIQDLAKLSRYFRQGASPHFEDFLRGSPDTIMNLF